ncbi:MAG TPA: DUF2167 domain-containing protein [Verrucomicrobiae bacterium]|nr:DUF2167 domain-containing protein [Verrucomicrobiae bacterium]
MKMRVKSACLLALGAAALVSMANAQDNVPTRAELQQIVQGLKYQHGEIKLQNGLATLEVPTNFVYLDSTDAATVLVKLWGNPPSQSQGILGLLMPADQTPLDPDCWVVTIEYDADGYVKDTDAGKINYDDLLKQMQSDMNQVNQERQKNGYPTIQLVDWAAPPRYDAATHKLYWAKDLKFEGEPADTLNYNIRILGRRGVLILNAVAGMSQLPEIEKQTSQILGMVDFDQGNRYADFNPKTDKMAAYGLAALVAGGVAAKLGFFKLFWLFILGAKKFIIIAAVAVAAWFRKIFKRGNPTTQFDSKPPT